jgi:hypothetical protein
MKALPLLLALALGLTGLATLPARAQTSDRDRALLSTFCDSASIKGSTCERAKNYPNAGRRGCDVKLGARYGGRFIASGDPLLVVAYESGCEAHVTDFGGAIVFEEVSGQTVFRAFLPGATTRDCVTVPKDAQQDLLICLTGHSGQGCWKPAWRRWRSPAISTSASASRRISC